MGSIWLLYALGFNTSVAVWVGLIGLPGIAAETASIMVIYLDEGGSGAKRRCAGPDSASPP